MKPFLKLISLVLPDNFININNEKFRSKALAQSKLQNSEHGENVSSSHGKHLVFVNLKLHGKHICPKIRTLADVAASCYFVHLKKSKGVLLLIISYSHLFVMHFYVFFSMFFKIKITSCEARFPFIALVVFNINFLVI